MRDQHPCHERVPEDRGSRYGDESDRRRKSRNDPGLGEGNRIIPVTVLRVEPARIVQVKTSERDGYTAVQVTFGHKDPKKFNKPEAGHFAKAGVAPGRRLVELRLDSVDGFEVGQEIGVDTLAAGELVDVTAISRGKGFAGTMKRHNF